MGWESGIVLRKARKRRLVWLPHHESFCLLSKFLSWKEANYFLKCSAKTDRDGEQVRNKEDLCAGGSESGMEEEDKEGEREGGLGLGLEGGREEDRRRKGGREEEDKEGERNGGREEKVKLTKGEEMQQQSRKRGKRDW